jgi:hypothetical protein
MFANRSRSYHFSMMKKATVIPSLAFVAGALVCAVHAPSSAQTAGASDQSADRWICRRAESSTKSNATMNQPETIQLQCKSIKIVMRPDGSDMMVIGSVHATSRLVAPSYSSALTPAQINDAWMTFIRGQVFGQFDNRGGA